MDADFNSELRSFTWRNARTLLFVVASLATFVACSSADDDAEIEGSGTNGTTPPVVYRGTDASTGNTLAPLPMVPAVDASAPTVVIDSGIATDAGDDAVGMTPAITPTIKWQCRDLGCLLISDTLCEYKEHDMCDRHCGVACIKVRT